jgi:hypothetical protein
MVEDTVFTFKGYIKLYSRGSFSRDIFSDNLSDNSADQRLYIKFSTDNIITPIITSNGQLLIEKFIPKSSYGGRFSDTDPLAFQIFIEPGHTPVINYYVTGIRINE